MADTATDAVGLYQKILRRRLSLIALLSAVIIVSLLLDFTSGPAGLGYKDLLRTLFAPDEASPTMRVIVWEIRLPYALMAAIVGMALGLAGAEMQTILNNPLASPFTLGMSSAAALGAALAIVWHAGVPGIPEAWLAPVNAFIFAALAALLLDAITRWGGIDASGTVLVGIALVFTFNALLSLIQFTASAQALQNLVFWTMGSLARANWTSVGLLAFAVAATLPFSMRQSWRLTALRLGEDRAASFGVDIRRLRLAALARISLLCGLAVAFVGTIGFIGLVSPHIARRLFGEDHRYYLPGSALVGALILSLASFVSKNLLPDLIVPIGIITTLVGIPFFVSIVLRRRLS